MRHIVVVGNDGAACAAATALATSLQRSHIRVCLLKTAPDDAMTPIEVCTGGQESFHHILGLDERVLQQHADTSVSLGTRYQGLSGEASDSFVPLGRHGKTLRLVDFHHYLLKRNAAGHDDKLNDYSLPAAQAAAGHYRLPADPEDDVARTFAYELHVERKGYAAFLLSRAAQLGVDVIESSVASVESDGDGAVSALALSNGSRLEGELFVDCSADRCVMNQIAGSGDFDDWSKWFGTGFLEPANTEQVVSPDLFARVEISDGTWIHRISTGQVTSSTTMAANGASGSSESGLTSAIGKFTRPWVKNCIAIGRAVASVPAIEVSTLQLAHKSILRLLAMLPRERICSSLADEFNRISNAELNSVRDYQLLIISFARASFPTAEGRPPKSLQERIDLFRSRGRFTTRDNEYFDKSRWVAALINLGGMPQAYDPVADMIDEERMRDDLRRFRRGVIGLGTG